MALFPGRGKPVLERHCHQDDPNVLAFGGGDDCHQVVSEAVEIALPGRRPRGGIVAGWCQRVLDRVSCAQQCMVFNEPVVVNDSPGGRLLGAVLQQLEQSGDDSGQCPAVGQGCQDGSPGSVDRHIRRVGFVRGIVRPPRPPVEPFVVSGQDDQCGGVVVFEDRVGDGYEVTAGGADPCGVQHTVFRVDGGTVGPGCEVLLEAVRVSEGCRTAQDERAFSRWTRTGPWGQPLVLDPRSSSLDHRLSDPIGFGRFGVLVRTADPQPGVARRCHGVVGWHRFEFHQRQSPHQFLVEVEEVIADPAAGFECRQDDQYESETSPSTTVRAIGCRGLVGRCHGRVLRKGSRIIAS